MAKIGPGIVAAGVAGTLFVNRALVFCVLGLLDRYLPVEVKSVPFRAFRVGRTQSKKSTPSITASRISSGVPTPIRYRGASSGRRGRVPSRISSITDLGSPTLSPPTANPWKSIWTRSLALSLRRSGYIPPWTMAKRAGSSSSPCLKTSFCPTGRPLCRGLHIFIGRRVGDTFVEDHGDVRTEGSLNLDHSFRTEKVERAIEMRLKGYSLLGNLPEITETEDLIASAVGQNGSFPMHEGMESSQSSNDFMSGPEVEMVGISQDGFHTHLHKLFRGKGFDRSLGSHGKKGRGRERTMRGLNSSPASPESTDPLPVS